MLRKSFRKAIGFFAMIFRVQHAGDHGNIRTRRNKLAHQFTRQTAIQPGFHTHDAGAPAIGSIGGDTHHTNSFFFRFVDQRLKPFGISRGQNDPTDTVLQRSLNASVSFSPRTCTGRLIKVIPTGQPVETRPGRHPRVDRKRSGSPGACRLRRRAGSRHRQGSRRQIRRISDLPCHLQDPMPGRLFDSSAAMQRSVHRSD